MFASPATQRSDVFTPRQPTSVHSVVHHIWTNCFAERFSVYFILPRSGGSPHSVGSPRSVLRSRWLHRHNVFVSPGSHTTIQEVCAWRGWMLSSSPGDSSYFDVGVWGCHRQGCRVTCEFYGSRFPVLGYGFRI